MPRSSFATLIVLAACTRPVASDSTSLQVAPATHATAASSPPVVAPSAPATAIAAPAPTLPIIDFAAHGLGETGCFMLRDLTTGIEQVSSRERCAQGRRPHSTFKIPNALIGADLGLLTSADTIMVWDRARYPKQKEWFDGWDRDQSLRDAMRISAVPLFRKLASDIGPERMAAYLAKLDYGNRDMSGGLDSFWLQGGMRITAAQQLDLISKLVRDELPVSKQAQAIVREVLKRDPVAGVPHSGKTGTGRVDRVGEPEHSGPMGGWLVGWIELPRGPVAYAMWVEAPEYEVLRDLRLKTVDGVLGEVVRTWQ